MKTIFPFTLEIDEQKFSLEYVNLGKKNAQKIQKAQEEITKDLQAYEKATKDLELLEQEKDTKVALAGVSEDEQKQGLLIEVVSLLEQIAGARQSCEELSKKTLNFEDINTQIFNFCVKGQDLQKLKEAIANKEISYSLLLDEIGAEIKAQKKKKPSA